MSLNSNQFDMYYGLNFSSDEESWPFGIPLANKLFEEPSEYHDLSQSLPETALIKFDIQEVFFLLKKLKKNKQLKFNSILSV